VRATHWEFGGVGIGGVADWEGDAVDFVEDEEEEGVGGSSRGSGGGRDASTDAAVAGDCDGHGGAVQVDPKLT